MSVVRSAETRAGRSVADILKELRADGLIFIYNTQAIDDGMRVAREPQAAGGVQLAREILAEHDLVLLQVAPNTYAVVLRKADARTQSDRAEMPGELLAEVVVQSSRYTLTSDTADSHLVLTQEQVKNLPRLGDETLRAVQRLPGAAVNGLSSVAAMRGGAPNETGIVLDGMRLYEPFHLKNFLSPMSLLDARLIDSIEVYVGNFPAQYGDRMSAVIDAKTIHPAAPNYYELGMSVFHLNGLASLEFADGDAGVLVSARRSNLSELSRLSENDFGRPSYSDGFARLDYAFDERTHGSFSVLLSRDEIVARRDHGAQRTEAEYRNGYAWATVTHAWTDSAATRLLAGYSDVTNNRYGQVDQPAQRVGAINDVRAFRIANARLDHSWQSELFGLTLRQSAGAEARQLSGNYTYASDVRLAADYPFPGSPARNTQRGIVSSADGDEIAAYWDARVDFTPRWAAQIGIRFDDQSEYFTRHVDEWSPRISVLFAPTPTMKLRAGWGRFFQAQSINELQVEDGVEQFHPPQHADHLVLGVERSFGDGWRARVEFYRKQYRNLQLRFENLFDPLSLLPEVEFDRVRIAPESARADGVELLVNARVKPAWSGWFGYTWSRARDRIGGVDVPRSWDQTHAFSAGVEWTRGRWSTTLTNTYHTGWPTTDVSLTSSVAIETRNAARLSAFNSLDLRASRTFPLRRGTLDVYVEAINLFDRRNDCCVDYSATRDSGGTIVLERAVDSWFGLLPSAGILWRY